MTVMLLDLNNFAYRCRMPFKGSRGGGPPSVEGHPAVPEPPPQTFLFQFVRNLRALVEAVGATSLVFVKEGSPEHRYEIFPEYKGNRRVKTDDPDVEKKWQEIMALKEQVDDAVKFCLKNLEVTVLKHPKCEADDLIANIAHALAKEGKDVVVASNDQDFKQLLTTDETGKIRVYDTGKKEYMEKPDHDALVYKAIVGDKSDNIPGIPGYGPKKALKLTQAIADGSFDVQHMSQEHYEIYERNLKLVKFLELNQDDWRRVQADRGKFDPAALMIDLVMFDMPSLVEEKAFNRLCDTFGSLQRAAL